jgi:hypothetical protein
MRPSPTRIADRYLLRQDWPEIASEVLDDNEEPDEHFG